MDFFEKYTVLLTLETYGNEYEKVLEVYRQHPENVWTLIDEDGKEIIMQGLHFVNRINYIITLEKSKEVNEQYTVEGEKQ